MDPFFIPDSMDGMIVEFNPSSSYPNAVNGPAFSVESVSSNYMEVEESINSPPPPNPNPYSQIPDLVAANANMDYFHFSQMQMFDQMQMFYQMHLNYFSSQPLLPMVPMYVHFFMSFYMRFWYFPF